MEFQRTNQEAEPSPEVRQVLHDVTNQAPAVDAAARRRMISAKYSAAIPVYMRHPVPKRGRR